MSGTTALVALAAWYDAQRPTAERETERYVVCAGLAVLERLKETFPLERADYVTPKNQVKTSGRLIQGLIEMRLGPSPMYASEGAGRRAAPYPPPKRWRHGSTPCRMWRRSPLQNGSSLPWRYRTG